MERMIFHHNGREYVIYDALTTDEIKAIVMMGKERDRKLNPLNKKSARKYFEDTDDGGDDTAAVLPHDRQPDSQHRAG